MMKPWFSIVFLSLGLISGCSGARESKINYNAAKSMPGYGYVSMDFSKFNDTDYSKNIVTGKISYTIMYTDNKDIFFVDVEDVDYNGKVLEAYIPFFKGYKPNYLSLQW